MGPRMQTKATTQLGRSAQPRRATRSSCALAAIAVLCCLAAAGLCRVSPAVAQGEGAAGLAANFLNPFPENETWKALVVGDYLAEGLAPGLADAMAGETRLQMQRRYRPFAGLARVDIEEDAKALEEFVVREKQHIVVIMTGMADRTGIRLPNGRRLQVGQGEWRQQYAARVERIVRALRRRAVAVYWVGLPVTRRSDWNEDIETINDVVRERVLNNGARYIDGYKASADENGQFSDRGPDITGKVVRLRDPEGYDFTPAGYRKLAFFLERDLKRDMNAAREERSIPLAGTDAEQKRIVPETARPAPAGGEAAPPTGARDARASASPVARALTDKSAPSPGQPAAAPQAGDLRADNVRVTFKSAAAGGREEQVTIEIVRPAITQSVIQLVTRRDRGDKPSQVGDTLTDTLSNGLLVMRSITPSRGGDRGQSRAALTQQPFFIALSKGERLPPKPGRADDFRWPRVDDIPPPPQVLPVAADASSAAVAPSGTPSGRNRPRPQAPRPQPANRPDLPSAGTVFNP
jgi:uncharacterized protein